MANRTLSILVVAIFNAFALASSFANSSFPSKTIYASKSTSRLSTTTPPPSLYSKNACGTCGARVITMSTWQWSQWIFPHTVGKVFVVIDDSTNSTRTSTSLETVAITAGDETISASDWMANGTFQPLKSRRTATMTHVIDQSTTLTYPSRLIRIGATEISWDGEVPISQGNDTDCLDAETAPPLTMTTALPSLAPHSVDPNDPLGEFYKAIDFAGEHILKADEVGTYFGPTASMVYDSCTGVGTLPASWATSALFLLETSTQRINTQAQASSSSPDPTPEPSPPPKAQSEELEVPDEPSNTKTQVGEATMLVSATAANSPVTSHITISFTHPGTVASWAEAAQNLLSTSAAIQESNASPTTTTVDGDAVASVVASILGMTKTKEETQTVEETTSAGKASSAMSTEASGQTVLSSNFQDQQLTDSTYIAPSSSEEVAPTQGSFSEPHVSNSEVRPALVTSQTLHDQASQTPSTSSQSKGSETPDTLALSSGHSDNVQQSSYPAAQSTATSAGSSRPATQTGSTVSLDRWTDDSNPGLALQSSTRLGTSETGEAATTLPASNGASQSSASSSTSVTEGHTRTTDASTPQPSSSGQSPPLIQSSMSPTSPGSLDVAFRLVIALLIAIFGSAC